MASEVTIIPYKCKKSQYKVDIKELILLGKAIMLTKVLRLPDTVETTMLLLAGAAPRLKLAATALNSGPTRETIAAMVTRSKCY